MRQRAGRVQLVLLTVATLGCLGGCLHLVLGHPITGPDVVTIAGMAMLALAWWTTMYFEITRMRTDEQGRRYYYTVWGWFLERILRMR